MTVAETVNQIHSALSSGEMYGALHEALVRYFDAEGISLLYHDADRGALDFSHSTLPEQTGLAEGLDELALDLLAAYRDRHCGPLAAGGRWPGPAAPPAACAPLLFQGSPFGLLLLHGPVAPPEGEPAAAFEMLATACGIEIVKLQLYESANSESQSAGSKISAVNNTAELLKNLDLETLLIKLMELSLNIMNAQVGSIMIAKDGRLESTVEFGLRHEVMQAIRTADGSSYAEAVLAAGEPVLIPDMAARDDIDLSALEVNIHSMIITPLVTKTERLGLINIVNNDTKFEQTDYDILTTITNLAANAVENAILQARALESERLQEQMNIARRIQESLLPSEAPELPMLDLAGWSLACDETGGDYYDYLEVDEQSLGLVVGDATGHGLGAALTMLITRSALKTAFQGSQNLARNFDVINVRLEADTDDDRFMTLFAGVIDLRALTLNYCSAGHDGPLWFHARDGSIEELESTGFPLGMIAEIPYEMSAEYTLEPDDILVLGTDGIWEAMNAANEEYGKQRLAEVVRAHTALSAQAISQAIERSVKQWISDAAQRDDITIIVAKVRAFVWPDGDEEE